MSKRPPTFEQWLETRPPIVQKLLAEFPIGTKIVAANNELWYVVGATESPHEVLVISTVSPQEADRNDEGYDRMVANKTCICAHHLRGHGHAYH